MRCSRTSIHVQSSESSSTDEWWGYHGLSNREVVRPCFGHWVYWPAHTNRLESFWSPMKCGHHGAFGQTSGRHLDRHVGESECRHNRRGLDAFYVLGRIVRGLDGKRLNYKDLAAT